MMSMYGFEPRTLPAEPPVRSTPAPAARLALGAVLSGVGLYGAASSFDPVTLSVVQVFFLVLLVLGVVVMMAGRELT